MSKHSRSYTELPLVHQNESLLLLPFVTTQISTLLTSTNHCMVEKASTNNGLLIKRVVSLQLYIQSILG